MQAAHHDRSSNGRYWVLNAYGKEFKLHIPEKKGENLKNTPAKY